MRTRLLTRLFVGAIALLACVLPAADAVSALAGPGSLLDEQTSLVYMASDYLSYPAGTLLVNTPASTDLTSINIDSTANLFLQPPPGGLKGLGGSFDSYGPDHIFKATFGGSFGDTEFGVVLPGGLSFNVVLNDLTAVGSLVRGGALGPVDLVYVDVTTSMPEPSTAAVFLGLTGVAFAVWRRR